MNVIDSYRDTAGAIDLINASVDQYREVYKGMGMDVKARAIDMGSYPDTTRRDGWVVSHRLINGSFEFRFSTALCSLSSR